jgi:hypothetical protein
MCLSIVRRCKKCKKEFLGMKAEDIYDKALTEYPIKEKLNKKAVGTYDANYPRRKAFIAGAEWMQEEMIEKAVEWMKNNLHEFYANVSYQNLFDEFKQAMEE